MKEALNCCEVDSLADLITQRNCFVEIVSPLLFGTFGLQKHAV